MFITPRDFMLQPTALPLISNLKDELSLRRVTRKTSREFSEPSPESASAAHKYQMMDLELRKLDWELRMLEYKLAQRPSLLTPDASPLR